MDRGWLRAAILDRDTHQNVVHAGLGVLDEHVEIAVVREQAGIYQLIFGLPDSAAAAFLCEMSVGVFALRILVEHLQVGVRRSGIGVVVEFLDVLAVIALAVSEPEQALLQYG